MILVPVKNLSGAKQRLAAILDRPARTELAQAMLLDVLETVANCAHRSEVGIVTSDPFALQLAHQFHFTVIPDDTNRSETDAIEIATRFCESHGIDSTLVIPGDIPLIQSWELERIIASAPTEGSVLVPAATAAAPMPSSGAPQACSRRASAMTASSPTTPPPRQPGSPALCCRFRA